MVSENRCEPVGEIETRHSDASSDPDRLMNLSLCMHLVLVMEMDANATLSGVKCAYPLCHSTALAERLRGASPPFSPN
jgi:hypothetical protein